MTLYIYMLNLYTLLDRQWLSSRTIDKIFAELAVLLLGIKLISFEKVFYHLCKFQWYKYILAANIIYILPDTYIFVFLFNFSQNYYYITKAICQKKICFLTIFNFLAWLEKKRLRINKELIKTLLPPILDYIIYANLINTNLLNNILILQLTDSKWASNRVA